MRPRCGRRVSCRITAASTRSDSRSSLFNLSPGALQASVRRTSRVRLPPECTEHGEGGARSRAVPCGASLTTEAHATRSEVAARVEVQAPCAWERTFPTVAGITVLPTGRNAFSLQEFDGRQDGGISSALEILNKGASDGASRGRDKLLKERCCIATRNDPAVDGCSSHSGGSSGVRRLRGYFVSCSIRSVPCACPSRFHRRAGKSFI